MPPAEEPEEMPLPSDPKVIFLGGLFALALLDALYVAAEIVLPLVLAIVLKLLLQPMHRCAGRHLADCCVRLFQTKIIDRWSRRCLWPRDHSPAETARSAVKLNCS